MKVPYRFLALGIVTALALPLLSRTAHATSVSGWSGKTTPSQETCFSSQGAGVINNAGLCTGFPSPTWDIPLALTSGGSHTTRIYGVAGTQNASCTLYGFVQNGTINSQQTGSLPSAGVLTLTVTVPSTAQGSNLLIRCSLGNGAAVYSVDYNS